MTKRQSWKTWLLGIQSRRSRNIDPLVSKSCSYSVSRLSLESLEPRIVLSGTPQSPFDVSWMDQGDNIAADEWIIRFEHDLSGKADQVNDWLLVDDEPLQITDLGINNLARLTAPDLDSATLQGWAQQSQKIAYVEPNYVYQATVLPPNDTSYSQLWGLNNTGQSGGTIDADIDGLEAWELTTGSSDIVVGVIDTGVDYTHPDLYLNMWINQDEIPSTIGSELSDMNGDDVFTFFDLCVSRPLTFSNINEIGFFFFKISAILKKRLP